jgi:CspA family cold shock protein
MQGTIRRLVVAKGFGFIEGTDHTEYFFHRSAVRENGFDDLREGQTVEFEVQEGSAKGPRAQNVR